MPIRILCADCEEPHVHLNQKLCEICGLSADAVLWNSAGLEAAARTRKSKLAKGQYTPILAMTAHTAARDGKCSLEAGMDRYHAKSIRRELLQKEIVRVTNESNAVQKETAALSMVASMNTGWNITELLCRLDNDHEFLRAILRVFREDSRISLHTARSALAEGDLGALQRAAHTLKGMLRNLMMNRAAETAGELEDAARAKKSEELAGLLTQLEQAVAALLPEVEAESAEVKA